MLLKEIDGRERRKRNRRPQHGSRTHRGGLLAKIRASPWASLCSKPASKAGQETPEPDQAWENPGERSGVQASANRMPAASHFSHSHQTSRAATGHCMRWSPHFEKPAKGGCMTVRNAPHSLAPGTEFAKQFRSDSQDALCRTVSENHSCIGTSTMKTLGFITGSVAMVVLGGCAIFGDIPSNSLSAVRAQVRDLENPEGKVIPFGKDGIEVLTQGPVHEAFAQPATGRLE